MFIDAFEVRGIVKALLEVLESYQLVQTTKTTVTRDRADARIVVEYSIKKKQGSV